MTTGAGRERAAEDVRIALVLNGGVSLAVWMGGVTHELDLLRRASRVALGASEADVGGVAAHDAGVFATWVDLCRLAGVGEVVVDVVAGTSAGGLNGTFLATAVARGTPLDPPGRGARARLREVWDTQAALSEGQLLRAPGRGTALPSVFDGDFVQRAVGDVLHGIEAAPEQERRDPVTLFVTGTALGASARRYVDSFGQPFDVDDHRRLYRFRRTEVDGVAYAPRAGEAVETWWSPAVVDDFTDGSGNGPDGAAHTALTTAARASSSFPFAFAPVREGPELARRRVLPPRAVEPEGRRWLVDGGVLDNAPFQPVLDAISRRPLTGPVRRLLVYVVPSGGAAEAPAGDDHDDPRRWPTIATSALGFPREGDVRGDVEHVADLLDGAEGSHVGPEAAFRSALAGDTSAAAGLFGQYRAGRAVGGLLEVRGVVAAADPGRAAVLAPRAGVDLDRLLALDLPWVPPVSRGVEPSDGPWAWGLGAAERVVRLAVRDLRVRLRDGEPVDRGHLAGVSAALTRLEAVRDAVNAHLSAAAGSAPTEDGALVAWTRDRFAELHVREALTRCVQDAAREHAAARAGQVEARAVVRAGLVVEVATQAFTAYRPFRRTAPFELLRLGPDVDTPLVDHGDGALARARREGDAKLYGTRLGHFAAFGLPHWRAWDWTAGRLDAQTHLVRALLGRGAAGEELVRLQELTVASELGLDAAGWAGERDRLRGVDDAALLASLRSTPEGERLSLALVDALMRALPHEDALGRHGLLVNALLARDPRRRWRPWWLLVARPMARRRWVRWTSGLGRPRRRGRARRG